MAAFRKALVLLTGSQGTPSRLHAIQLVLSDPRTELLEQLDQKGAFGAYGRADARGR